VNSPKRARVDKPHSATSLDDPNKSESRAIRQPSILSSRAPAETSTKKPDASVSHESTTESVEEECPCYPVRDNRVILVEWGDTSAPIRTLEDIVSRRSIRISRIYPRHIPGQKCPPPYSTYIVGRSAPRVLGANSTDRGGISINDANYKHPVDDQCLLHGVYSYFMKKINLLRIRYHTNIFFL
jgi:hypothetical protein